MKTKRKTAIIVGVLYIIGTVAGVLSVVITQPILHVPDYLKQVSANQNQFVLAALLVLTMGLALAMVPVLMFPILKKQNEVLALGYIVFRSALESVSYIVTVIVWLFLLVVSQDYGKAGVAAAVTLQSLGAILQESSGWISQIVTITFIFGAVMFYFILFRSKLIPRWLSGWGLVGAIPYFSAGLLVMFGFVTNNSTIDSVLRLPIGVQEMVMAVWLIAKGFSPSAIAALSARENLS